MSDVKDLLKKEIEEEINSLEDIPYGSPEYKTAAEITVKFLDKYNEMIRIEQDYLDKKESREQEKDLKIIEMETDKKDRIVKNLLTGVSVVVGGIVIPIWGTIKTLKFEETGTVTSMAGRAFIGSLFKKK